MKINDIKVIGDKFAYDGCHKIYIIEDEKDMEEAIFFEYELYSIDEIENIYNTSCNLKFIRNWKLDKSYVEQFKNATFEYSL